MKIKFINILTIILIVSVLFALFLLSGGCSFFIKSADKGTVHCFTANDIAGHYRVFNESASNQNGVLFWFHGDGQEEYDNPKSPKYIGGYNGILAVAKRHNMQLIVPEAPSNDGIWWKHGEENGKWATALIEKEKQNSERVYLAGFSGGAEELSYFIIPNLETIGVTKGSATLFAGGGSPVVEGLTKSITKSKTVRGSYSLNWVVGSGDSGWDDDGFNALTVTKQGYHFYRSQGWSVNRVVVPSIGHELNFFGIGIYGVILNLFI